MIEKSDFSLSFEPVIFQNTEILILGSLPGRKSIELNQYYGHSRR
jgi:G:T/U-mismatch repair DNA glycosylase